MALTAAKAADTVPIRVAAASADMDPGKESTWTDRTS